MAPLWSPRYSSGNLYRSPGGTTTVGYSFGPPDRGNDSSVLEEKRSPLALRPVDSDAPQLAVILFRRRLGGERPDLLNRGGEGVRSAGVAIQLNVFGYAVLEFD